jgi:Armadillo/beta-catenin-like repeat
LFTHVSNAPQAECSAEIGNAVELVVGRLQDDDDDVQQAALKVIANLADISQSVNSLFMNASDAPQVECHPQIAGVVQPVVSLLQSKNYDVRRAVLVAILKLATVGESFSPPHLQAYLILPKRNAVPKLQELYP